STCAYRLTGTKLFVADAATATDLIVAVRTGDGPSDLSLLHVDARARGVAIRRLSGFVTGQCEVIFDNVDVPVDRLLGGREHQGWMVLSRALERALPLLCAYIVGGGQAGVVESVAPPPERG